MSRSRIVGFETGDLSEVSVAGSSAIESTTINTAGGGAYSLKLPAGASGVIPVTGCNLARMFYKIYFRFSNGTTPATNIGYAIGEFKDSSGTTACLVVLTQQSDATFTLQIYDSLFASTNFAALTFTNNVWYRMEFDVTKGAGTGACTVYQNGVNIASVSSKQFGANNIDKVQHGQSDASQGAYDHFLDDIEVDGAALCGVSYVLARQFRAGTPTYDDWTKSSGTIDTVWSDTPFSAASNATSSVVNDAQTALVAAFSNTQTGHGAGVIGSSDTINGAKAGLVGKAASSSAASIRVRKAAADTDTAITLTTSDAYYETAVFTDTFNNLNTSEVGALQGADTVLQTVEDAWLMVSYTPAANVVGSQGIF